MITVIEPRVHSKAITRIVLCGCADKPFLSDEQLRRRCISRAYTLGRHQYAQCNAAFYPLETDTRQLLLPNDVSFVVSDLDRHFLMEVTVDADMERYAPAQMVINYTTPPRRLSARTLRLGMS